VYAALFSLVTVTLVVCVVTDVRARRIPDVVTWPSLALALGLRAGLGGIGDLEHGLLGGLAGAGLGLGLFGVVALAKRGLGWGDVKLMGAVGAALGLELTMAALLFTSLAGAVQAVAAVLYPGRTNSDQTPRHIPYGVAIAVGSAWAMWWGRSNLTGS
jgi:prepilin peptidase CpaA